MVMKSGYLLSLFVLVLMAGVCFSGPQPEYFEAAYVSATGDTDISEPFYAKCGTNFNDSFDVKVIDAKFRPIEGAWLTVTYQYSQTFANKYTKTNPGQTDKNGIRHYDVQNYEPYEDKVDCKIIIYGLIDQSVNATTIVANSHADPVIVYLSTAYKLTVVSKDGQGRILPGITVTLDNNESKVTDSVGMATFWVTARNITYIANYLKAKAIGQMDIVGDTTYEIKFKEYIFDIYLQDDKGNPLNGTVTVLGKTYQLGKDGRFHKNETWGNTVSYTATYRGITKTGLMNLDRKTKETVLFDIHAPTFSDVKYETVNDIPRLKITILDGGASSTGVDTSSITVRYKEGDDSTAAWSNARVFTYGKNTWIAEFQKLKPGVIVNFRIEAKDKEGNSATIDGKFVTQKQAPTLNSTNNNNKTINSTNSQKKEQDIPLLYIAGGIIALFIIIFLVFRIKGGGDGGG